MAARQLQGQTKTGTRTAKKPPASSGRTAVKQNGTMTTLASLTSINDLVPEHVFYVHRELGGRTDFEVFDFAAENHMNTLIEGPTGPGKTTAIMAWAATRKKAFYAISSNVAIDPAQLFGKWVPDGKGGFVWVDGFVTLLVRHGGCLLINEVNFMPERVSTTLFSLLDGRREMALLDHHGEVIKAHEDFVCMADMNPDYEGTRPLNKAFRNRFEMQHTWDYDRKVEEQLIKSTPLLDFMWRLRAEAATEVYSTPVSTNMGMEFEKIAKGLGYDFAVLNFINHFSADERESIRKLFEADRDNIEQTIDVEELSEDELYAKRLAMTIGDVDKEWGVYGVNWAWDDDDTVDHDSLVEVTAG